jgi:hypothetical protein
MEAATSTLQVLAQCQMIVNFAVEGDRGPASRVRDGLIAALKIENLQARGAERRRWRLEDALLIRAAMGQGFYGVPNAARRAGAPHVGKSRNAAHRSGIGRGSGDRPE